MKCLHPQRIYNKYIKQWMYVPCRHCEACRISGANGKAHMLAKEMEKYPYKYFVTLTYKNDCVPFITEFSNMVCRLASPVYDEHNKLSYQVEQFPDLLNVLDDYFSPSGEKPLSNFPIKDAIGVLHYRDYQNFIKRFNYYAKNKITNLESSESENMEIRLSDHISTLLQCQKETLIFNGSKIPLLNVGRSLIGIDLTFNNVSSLPQVEFLRILHRMLTALLITARFYQKRYCAKDVSLSVFGLWFKRI